MGIINSEMIMSFMICALQLQIKEDGVGGACSTHGRGEKCAQNFILKT
jgi:hypothetical protein